MIRRLAAGLGALLVALAPGCQARRGPSESASTPASAESSDACCAQCRAAASRDPQARSLDLFPCADYRDHTTDGALTLSPACVARFERDGATVGVCATAMGR